MKITIESAKVDKHYICLNGKRFCYREKHEDAVDMVNRFFESQKNKKGENKWKNIFNTY